MRHSTRHIAAEVQSRRILARRSSHICAKSEQAPSVNQTSAFGARDPGSAAIRILIADDLEQWRVQIRKLLDSRREWEVVSEACDGRQALEKAIELCPDIILLDVGMPVMNGIEAALKIRQRCRAALIIFVTHSRNEALRQAAVELGAAGYVLKNNIATELVSVIAAAVGQMQGPTQSGEFATTI